MPIRQIKIQHFGPIRQGLAENEGFLEIHRVTTLIGNQATGKSSIAKLISTMSWIEKVLFQGRFQPSEFTSYKRFKNKYCAQQGIQHYFRPDTYIEYRGQAYHFIFSNDTFSIQHGYLPEEYQIPKVTFIPAERNFLTVIEKVEKAKGLPFMLYTFLEEYQKLSRLSLVV
jgi:hypothetical protein